VAESLQADHQAAPSDNPKHNEAAKSVQGNQTGSCLRGARGLFLEFL